MTYTKEEQEKRKATQEKIKKEIWEAEIINRARENINHSPTEPEGNLIKGVRSSVPIPSGDALTG